LVSALLNQKLDLRDNAYECLLCIKSRDSVLLLIGKDFFKMEANKYMRTD